MKKLRIFILLALLCSYGKSLNAQLQNEIVGGASGAYDSTGLLSVWVNMTSGESNGLSVYSNFSGMPNVSPTFATGKLGGYMSPYNNYGVFGHVFGTGDQGQGGLFSFGLDETAPDRFVRLATNSHALQIVDGNEAAGYVLTSDAIGNASWTMAPAGTQWIDHPDGIYYDSGNVGVNTTPIVNAEMLIATPGGYAGPDTTGLFVYREGSNVSNADGAGSGWDMSGVSSGIKGFSDYGNTFSAGVAGYGYLDFVNSAALIGAKEDASVWGALGYKDSTNRNWGGYIGAGDFFVNGMNAGVQGVFGEDSYLYVNYTDANLLVASNSAGFNSYPSLALVNTQDTSGCAFFGVRGTDGGGVTVADPLGLVYQDVNASAFNVSSDRSVKKDIVTIDPSNVEQYLGYIRNIESASFRYKTEDVTSRPAPHIGVIAQSLPDETIAVMKREAGRSDSDDILGVSLADLLGLTLVGVKHLDAENQAKDAKIIELESRIETLEKALTTLLENEKK